MSFEVSNGHAESMRAKAILVTAKGMIGLSVLVFQVVSSNRTISLLEVRGTLLFETIGLVL